MALLGLVGASSFTLFALTVGQSIGGAWRKTALLAPRNADPGSGPNGFQINRKAVEAGITTAMVDASWRLKLDGAREVELSRSPVARDAAAQCGATHRVCRGLVDRRSAVEWRAVA